MGASSHNRKLPEEVCTKKVACAAGNIAHLLNHSCAPNCYSRTVSVRSSASGRLADHVVIFARRDIAPGEELTYDYRCTPLPSPI